MKDVNAYPVAWMVEHALCDSCHAHGCRVPWLYLALHCCTSVCTMQRFGCQKLPCVQLWRGESGQDCRYVHTNRHTVLVLCAHTLSAVNREALVSVNCWSMNYFSLFCLKILGLHETCTGELLLCSPHCHPVCKLEMFVHVCVCSPFCCTVKSTTGRRDRVCSQFAGCLQNPCRKDSSLQNQMCGMQ